MHAQCRCGLLERMWSVSNVLNDAASDSIDMRPGLIELCGSQLDAAMVLKMASFGAFLANSRRTSKLLDALPDHVWIPTWCVELRRNGYIVPGI